MKTGLRALKDEEMPRMLELLKKVQDIEAFEVEGTLYLGMKVIAIREFLVANPNKADFSVWLDKNYPILIKQDVK